MSTPLCAICGERSATTRDHVPPRAVFPRPLPVIMITVPACAQCNNGAHIDDERFRVYLAMTTTYYSNDATNLWRGGALRSLTNNARLQREISENSEIVRVVCADGSSQERRIIRWPVSRHEPVVERIARGLYFHHTRAILGRGAACAIDRPSYLPAELLDLTGDWPTPHVGDSIFRYRYHVDENDPRRSLWIFQFLGVSWAIVESYPVDGEPIAVRPQGHAIRLP